MIKSMTGYGRARETLNKRDITVEVRSVNNRYLDCTVKMPRMYAFAEDAVKQHVQKAGTGNFPELSERMPRDSELHGNRREPRQPENPGEVRGPLPEGPVAD